MTHQNDELVHDMFEKLIAMNNHLGHQVLALESICGWLVADSCMRQPDPDVAVRKIVSMLMGTAAAVSDNVSRGDHGQTTAGTTQTMERVGTIAEKTLRLRLAQGGEVRAAIVETEVGNIQ